MSLVATALAAAAWFRPEPHTNVSSTSPSQTFTDREIADAKSRACAAFEIVRSAAELQNQPKDGDPLAATANARLSLMVGSAYLLARLNPATPPALATAVRTLADDLLELAENAMAGAQNDDPAQAQRIQNADAADKRISELCK